jgi:hypothetical protein
MKYPDASKRLTHPTIALPSNCLSVTTTVTSDVFEMGDSVLGATGARNFCNKKNART